MKRRQPRAARKAGPRICVRAGAVAPQSCCVRASSADRYGVSV